MQNFQFFVVSSFIEAEKKERETEIANMHHALSAHNYEIEALRNKVTDVETLNNTMLNGIGKYQIFQLWIQHRYFVET